MSLLYWQFHAIGFLLYFIYDMYMDKFNILLNCNICEQVFDFEYTLTKHPRKFHLTFFLQIVTHIITVIIIIAIVVVLLTKQNKLFKDYAIQFK